MQTKKRKLEHLEIVAEKDVFFNKTTLLECVELVHNAFPEMNFKDVDSRVEFLGKKISAPVMIAAITGGAPGTERINKDLASVAEELGIPFGLGSQRAMIEDEKMTCTYYVRDVAPNVPVLGNIGAVQLRGNVDKVVKAVEAVEADGICVHINPAQEIAQEEGDRDFSGCLKAIEELVGTGIPVIVKEVGNGISKKVAEKLAEIGVYGIDVGGSGGTSWVKVDGLRGKSRVWAAFSEWGIPTAVSVVWTRSAFKGKIIATGGIRNGIEVAKSIALGADLCGIAAPVVIEYRKRGKEGVLEYFERVIKELKIAMFLTGSRDVAQLKEAEIIIKGELKEWLGI